MKKAIIAGAGISGLTVAYALLQKSRDIDITVLEYEQRPGGKVWSDRVNGYLCERGPNGFLDNKPLTLHLCEQLGLTPLRSNDNARKRYIFLKNRLNLIEASPLRFLTSDLITWRGKLRILYEPFAKRGPDDETVADFVSRRLGREALDKLIDPMSSGIFAGDPYKMSIRHCFPRIKELEMKYGSLIKAMIKLKRERKLNTNEKIGPAPEGTLTSFYEGAQALTDAISNVIGNRLKLGVFVKGIERNNNKYRVYTSEGIYDADIVILACPAYSSSMILKDFDRDLSMTLLRIPYVPVSVVCFGLRKEKVGHSLKGFGFLVPGIEGRKILGTL
jgi:oxygen-dependent protoporphyrinogen oxidase